MLATGIANLIDDMWTTSNIIPAYGWSSSLKGQYSRAIAQKRGAVCSDLLGDGIEVCDSPTTHVGDDSLETAHIGSPFLCSTAFVNRTKLNKNHVICNG